MKEKKVFTLQRSIFLLVFLFFINGFAISQTIDIGPPYLEVCGIDDLVFTADVQDVQNYQVDWTISGNGCLYELQVNSNTTAQIIHGFCAPYYGAPPTTITVCASITLSQGGVIEDCINISIGHGVPSFNLTGSVSCGESLPDGEFHVDFNNPEPFFGDVYFSYQTTPQLNAFIHGTQIGVNSGYNIYIDNFVDYSASGNATNAPLYDAALCQPVTINATLVSAGCSATESMTVNFVNPTYPESIVKGPDPAKKYCGFTHSFMASHPGCDQEWLWDFGGPAGDQTYGGINNIQQDGNDLIIYDFKNLTGILDLSDSNNYPIDFNYFANSTSNLSVSCPLSLPLIHFQVVREEGVKITGNSNIVWCDEGDFNNSQQVFNYSITNPANLGLSYSLFYDTTRFDVLLDTSNSQVLVTPIASYSDYPDKSTIIVKVCEIDADSVELCCSELYIIFEKAASFENVTADVIACVGEPVYFNSNQIFQTNGNLHTISIKCTQAPSGNGVVNVNEYFNIENPNFNLSFLQSGSYSFEIDIDPNNFFNCPDNNETANFTIHVIESVGVSIVNLLEEICPNEEYIPQVNYYDGLQQLPSSVANNFFHHWDQIGGSALASISDANIKNPTITGFQAGQTYVFRYTAGTASGCSSSDEITITGVDCACTLDFVSIEKPDCIQQGVPFDVTITYDYSGPADQPLTSGADFPGFTVNSQTQTTFQQGQNSVTFNLTSNEPCDGEQKFNYSFGIGIDTLLCGFEQEDFLTCCNCEHTYHLEILDNCSSCINTDPCATNAWGYLGVYMGVFDENGTLISNNNVVWSMGDNNIYYPGGSGTVTADVYENEMLCQQLSMSFECSSNECQHTYTMQTVSDIIGEHPDPCEMNPWGGYIDVFYGVFDEFGNQVLNPSLLQFTSNLLGTVTPWYKYEGVPETVGVTVFEEINGELVECSTIEITIDCPEGEGKPRGEGKSFSQEFNNSKEFFFFPNPVTNEKLIIEYTGDNYLEQNVQYTISDATGRQISSDWYVLKGKKEIAMKGIESGMYFIVLKDSNGRVISQTSFIKE